MGAEVVFDRRFDGGLAPPSERQPRTDSDEQCRRHRDDESSHCKFVYYDALDPAKFERRTAKQS
jgi:hypothetical protein